MVGAEAAERWQGSPSQAITTSLAHWKGFPPLSAGQDLSSRSSLPHVDSLITRVLLTPRIYTSASERAVWKFVAVFLVAKTVARDATRPAVFKTAQTMNYPAFKRPAA